MFRLTSTLLLGIAMWFLPHVCAAQQFNWGGASNTITMGNPLVLPSSGVTWAENIHNQSNSALLFDGTNYAIATNSCCTHQQLVSRLLDKQALLIDTGLVL